MITQRAVIIGLVGGCFYLITIVNSLPPYFYVLTWLAASVLVSCFGLALLSLQGLDCKWRVERKSASETLGEGDEIAVGPVIGIEMSNVGTLNKTSLVLEVRLRRDGERHGERRAHRKAPPGIVRRFVVESLPARGHLSSELVILELKRGRYSIREVRVVGSDVLGLFRAFKRVRLPRDMAEDKSVAARSELLAAARRTRARVDSSLATTTARAYQQNEAKIVAPREDESDDRAALLLIGPATVGFGRSATGISREAAGGDSASSDLTGRGDELRGTRPYVAGDDLRSVHWKSTARLGELVVREFDRTSRAESVVIWDGGAPVPAVARKARQRARQTTVRQRAARAPEIEQGLRVAASLCRALVESGKPCALLRLDSDPKWIPAPRRAASLALGQFSDALAVADCARVGALADALALYLRHIPPGADVWLVSASGGENGGETSEGELRRAVHALQRLGTDVCVVQMESSAPLGASGVAANTVRISATVEDEMAPVRAAVIEALEARSGAQRTGPRRETVAA